MLWDVLLIGVFVHSVLRGVKRGGRAVAIELACFASTYAATFSLGPWLAALVRARMERPPPLLPFLSFLAVYLVARRLRKLAFPRLRAAEPDTGEKFPVAETPGSPRRASQLIGAMLGTVRATVVVATVACLGFCVGIVQQSGGLRGLPPAETSIGVTRSAALVEFVVERFTADAGPTTKLLFDVALRPENGESLRKLMNSPFLERVKSSDELRVFTRDVEVRALLKERRTAELVVHPAFVRVLVFSMNELGSQ